MKKLLTACRSQSMPALFRSFLLGSVLAATVLIPAFADPAASDGQGNNVILHKDACTNPKVLATIPAEYQSQFRSAEAFLNKSHFDACWMITPDGSGVALVYEDGDVGVVPINLFKERGV